MASLIKGMKNWFRQKKDDAANTLADPVRDGKFAIEDSKKQIAEFRHKVAGLLASNKGTEKRRNEAKEGVKKWTSIAKKAAEAGNKNHVGEAILKKQDIEKEVSTLNKQVKQNETVITTLRKQIDIAQNKIATAASNHSRLTAQLEGARVRKELAKASADFGDGNSPLSALDDLEKVVNTEECEAEALEDISGVNDTSLEDEYNSNSVSVDDEVEKLMASVK